VVAFTKELREQHVGLTRVYDLASLNFKSIFQSINKTRRIIRFEILMKLPEKNMKE
jgi:hypothetical protein